MGEVYGAVNVYGNLSSIFILAVLFFPITNAMLKSASLNHHYIKLAHLALFTVVASLMVTDYTYQVLGFQ
jgi:hypothetical protein